MSDYEKLTGARDQLQALARELRGRIEYEMRLYREWESTPLWRPWKRWRRYRRMVKECGL